MKKKPSYGLWTITILLICSYVFAKFQGGFVSWFIFYAFLPIVIMTFFLYFFALKNVQVEREIEKAKYTSGETVEVTLTIRNPYRIPFVYLMIKDTLDPRLVKYAEGTKQVIYGGFKKQFTASYVIQDIPRGVYQWNEVQLETGDLFGLIKKHKQFTCLNEIVVYPKYQKIRYWRTMNERNIGVKSSFNRQDEDVSTVMGIRDYAPGDRLARIHWKATARTNSLKTKEYEHQVTNDFMIFLDREKEVRRGQAEAFGQDKRNEALFERAVSLTASLARFVLKQHFSAGLVSYGETATVMNMARDQEQLYRLYEHLARVEQNTTYSFAKTILREVTFLPIGTTVVIITPQLNQRIVKVLNDLSYRKIKVEFFWVKHTAETSEEQNRCLGLLAASQISYYIVSDDLFEQALSGGAQHVSASTL